jgi:ribosomal protein L39E
MRLWRSTSLEIVFLYLCGALKEYLSGDLIALFILGIEGILLWRSYCVICIRNWRNTSLEIVLRYLYEVLKEYFSGDRVALFILGIEGLLLWRSYCVIYRGSERVLLWRSYCAVYMRHWRSTSLEIVLLYLYEALKEYFSVDCNTLFIRAIEGILLWRS